MATSGWQTEKFYHASGNAGYVDWYGNIYISSITHTGTNLRVIGKFRLAARGTSGYSAYYVNGMKGSMTNSSGSKVGTTQTLLGNNVRLNVGNTVDKNFDITISGVSASTTSYSLGFRMWACYNSSCSSTFWDVTKYWTINFEPSSAPSGLYINNISTAYNSVSATVGVGSWGSTGTESLSMLVLTQPYVAGLPHRYNNTKSGALSYTTTVNNSSNCPDAGCITIKGAGTYYTGVFAQNGAGIESRFAGPAVYTPPAPMASLTYTQTEQSTNVKINVSTVGGSSSVNNSNSVTTYMRYSTNGGSSYSNWISMGSGNAWNTYTGNFTCDYGSNVIIQTKQTYQGQDSTVKSVSFTATTGTAPSGGSVTITGSTWNTVSLQASGVDYGMPDGISGRTIVLGVHAVDDRTTKRQDSVIDSTSGSVTVDNSSVYHGGTALQLKGMLPVTPYVWADNKVLQRWVVDDQTVVYYLPPAPGSLTYTADAQQTYTLSYSGVVANNVTDYTAGDLTRTVRYKFGASGNWTYVENASVIALDTVTTQQILAPYEEDVYVEAWLTYKGKDSEVSSFKIPGRPRPFAFYGSVDGEAKEIEHLYGSVNGESVKITKLYGSVGGVAKEIFEDV